MPISDWIPISRSLGRATSSGWEGQFGVRGLIAIESVGPYVSIQHLGPMIHDGFFQPGFGIGHHPHRTNERLFYILSGQVEHDDALNHIRGTMEEGDLGRLTEGVRGMYHQEWNGADQVTRAFILVYHPDTNPPIPVAEFALLKAADRVPSAKVRVETVELVGPDSAFHINHSALRRYTDTSLNDGAELDVTWNRTEDCSCTRWMGASGSREGGDGGAGRRGIGPSRGAG